MRPPKCHPFTWSNLDLARAASFIVTLVLVLCGYFIGLKKSVFDPVQSIMFLGFISDSVKQAFILPYEKKKRFATLRASLIGMKLIPIKSLQKFAGKVVSFSLAIPAVKLFCREVNLHIGKGLRSSKPVRMSKNLKNELEHWIFVDSWEGFLLWKQERHFTVEITSDASSSGWGGFSHFLAVQRKQEITGVLKISNVLVVLL